MVCAESFDLIRRSEHIPPGYRLVGQASETVPELTDEGGKNVHETARHHRPFQFITPAGGVSVEIAVGCCGPRSPPDFLY